MGLRGVGGGPPPPVPSPSYLSVFQTVPDRRDRPESTPPGAKYHAEVRQ